MAKSDGWSEPQERDMPNVPRHGDSEEPEPHWTVVTDAHVLEEAKQENMHYAKQLSKIITDYDLRNRIGGKAAEIEAALKVDPNAFTGYRLALHRWLSWWAFDTLVGLVILANAVVIGFESSQRADMPIGCTGDCECQNQLDPSLACVKIPLWITLADYGFYAIYLVELSLRIAVYGVFVLRSHWVKFDAFLVTASTLDIILGFVSSSELLNQVMLVRLLRLARLARALRLMVQFQTLWQLVQGLFHSIGTIMWTFLLVTLLMYIYAVTGMELIKVQTDLPMDHPYNTAAAECFRDLMDAILTLLQVFSMDSIGSLYRPLIKQNLFCFVYFVAALLILSIALMNLVTAVMVNSSMDQASEDKEARKAWESARKAKQMEKLKVMFLELDEDGSGELSLEELLDAPEEMRHELVEIAGSDDLTELFHLLDYDGGGTIGVEEFCEGVLKATSSTPGAIELSSLVKQCSEILHNNREAVTILMEHHSTLEGQGKSPQAQPQGAATRRRSNSIEAAAERDRDLAMLDLQVTKLEEEFGKVHANIAQITEILGQRSPTRSPSPPHSKAARSKQEQVSTKARPVENGKEELELVLANRTMVFNDYSWSASEPQESVENKMQRLWNAEEREENHALADAIAAVLKRHPDLTLYVKSFSTGRDQNNHVTESAFKKDFEFDFPSETMDTREPYAHARALTIKRMLAKRGIKHHRVVSEVHVAAGCRVEISAE